MAENASFEVPVVLSIKRWIIHEIVSLMLSELCLRAWCLNCLSVFCESTAATLTSPEIPFCVPV